MPERVVQGKILKLLNSTTLIFQSFEVVCRGSETQLQITEKLK